MRRHFPTQAALGEQLAVYVPAETLAAMTKRVNPRSAQTLGDAVTRAHTLTGT